MSAAGPLKCIMSYSSMFRWHSWVCIIMGLWFLCFLWDTFFLFICLIKFQYGNVLFYYIIILKKPISFLMREKQVMDPDGKWGGVSKSRERKKITIRIYYLRKNYVSPIKKKRKQTEKQKTVLRPGFCCSPFLFRVFAFGACWMYVISHL